VFIVYAFYVQYVLVLSFGVINDDDSVYVHESRDKSTPINLSSLPKLVTV